MEGLISINGQAVFSAVLDIYIKIEVNQHGILQARGILDLRKEGARADWIGAAASLYFSGTEEKGMVINCIQGSLAGRDRDKKLMELPPGEMLGMAPGELAFSAKDGNAMIWMRDKRGIRLISQSKICLDAKGKIRIVGRNITLASQSRIVMANKDNDGVKIEGRR